MTTVARVFIGSLCLLVAAFSVFGFAASFEPGIGIGWKLGYAGVFTLSAMGGAAACWAGKGKSYSP